MQARSSLGRSYIEVCKCAGMGDVGFCNRWTMEITNNSRSQRILWLLEEIGAPYEIKFYDRDPVTNLAPPELIAVHPLGKSPVITDGDRTLDGDTTPDIRRELTSRRRRLRSAAMSAAVWYRITRSFSSAL